MRIPHIINKNTKEAYEPSKDALDLIAENLRNIVPENFVWDQDFLPTLEELCVEVLSKNFKDKPLLDELPCPDRNHLLEILDLELPLELVIPLINDEIYWQRRFDGKFGVDLVHKPKEWTWKSLYIEKHVEKMIEEAQPQHNDEDEMSEITSLCCPYITRLLITQLQCWKPPLHWDEEDIPEVWPIDHISFEPIFEKLTEIQEFSLIYGMNNVGDTFTWNMFKLSTNDCQKLARAVNYLKQLKILRIHRSRLEDQHIRVLMQGLIKNQTIEELDLSHCNIGNVGALCVAKLLSVHQKLRILNLRDNRINGSGIEGIGFVLLQEDSSPIEHLDLSLNPLAEKGAMGIMRALVRGTKIHTLSMAACEYDDEAPIRAGQMLKLNTSLKRLDLSNNWFDDEGGDSLVAGMEINRTLEWLDVRETDITKEQDLQIKKCLKRNRLGVEEIEESVGEEEEIGEEITEPTSEVVQTETETEENEI